MQHQLSGPAQCPWPSLSMFLSPLGIFPNIPCSELTPTGCSLAAPSPQLCSTVACMWYMSANHLRRGKSSLVAAKASLSVPRTPCTSQRQSFAIHTPPRMLEPIAPAPRAFDTTQLSVDRPPRLVVPHPLNSDFIQVPPGTPHEGTAATRQPGSTRLIASSQLTARSSQLAAHTVLVPPVNRAHNLCIVPVRVLPRQPPVASRRRSACQFLRPWSRWDVWLPSPSLAVWFLCLEFPCFAFYPSPSGQYGASYFSSQLPRHLSVSSPSSVNPFDTTLPAPKQQQRELRNIPLPHRRLRIVVLERRRCNLISIGIAFRRILLMMTGCADS